MSKVVILQSNYIPWKGYFDLINKADIFCFHDDLQYTKNDWRNRNQIKTKDGLKWLTIPCGTNEKRLICEVEIKDSTWQKKHWNLIINNYKKAPCFSKIEFFLNEFYMNNKWQYLSNLNQYLIKNISNEFLDIKTTKFVDSKDYSLKKTKSDRVIELLKKIGATEYISGLSAKNYLNEDDFINNNIKLTWIDYTKYKSYKQFHPPFKHKVSIIDLLMHIPKKELKTYII